MTNILAHRSLKHAHAYTSLIKIEFKYKYA